MIYRNVDDAAALVQELHRYGVPARVRRCRGGWEVI